MVTGGGISGGIPGGIPQAIPKGIPGGIHAVLYALFDADERLDRAAMRVQVDRMVAQGCDGITVLGLATEVAKLTSVERMALIDMVADDLGGRLPLSVTIAGNSVAEQAATARHAAGAGATWLILQPPMVGTYDAGVYLDFMARVAATTALPLAIQNAPQYLGRSLSPDDLAVLSARCPNLAGIKAEDAATGIAALAAAAPGLTVLGGRGGIEMTDCLRAGATGFVLAPDIAPRARRILTLWQAGDRDGAEALYAHSLPGILFTMQSLEHLICYGKRIFAAHAGLTVHDRQPALAPTASGLDLAAQWAGLLKESAT